MPITTNGTNITAATFNGTPLTQIIYNGTTVWTSVTEVNYFNNGTQNVPWTTGFSTGTDGFTNLNTANMYIEAGFGQFNSSTNERTLRTTNTVNLSSPKINTLYIDWEGQTSSPATSQTANFIVSTSPTASFSTFNARAQVVFSPFGGDRRITTLDVSGLIGSFHIRVHARDGSSLSSRWNWLRVYRIWGV
jgi:hypothetical protein